MTYFSQMAGLAVQNFVSAAVGIAVVVALIRGLVARSGARARQLLRDLIAHAALRPAPAVDRRRRSCWSPRASCRRSAATATSHARRGSTQTLALGPVASQEAIKELGTNGGGFFNVNSAMPFENPTWLSNFVEMLLDPGHPGRR